MMAPTVTDLFERFGCSVIPVKLDKKPSWALLPQRFDEGEQRMRGQWKPFQERKPTTDELSRWVKANVPAFAIVTGQISNRVVFDFDGPDGVALAQQWGIQAHRKTGSGGLHLDVEYPGWFVPTLNSKAKQELGRRWPGLDVKGDGGYCIAIGRNEKGPYEWLRDPEPDPMNVVPAEVWEFLREYSQPKQPTSTPMNGAGDHPARYAVTDTQRVDSERLIQKALDAAGAAGRNVAGFDLACQLRDNGYAEAEVLGIMQNYRSRVAGVNTKGQHEPYTDTEINASIREAFSKAPREPWTKPRTVTARGSRSSSRPAASTQDGASIANDLDGKDNCPQPGLPVIKVNNRQLREVSNEALTALQNANRPPLLFVRSGQMVSVAEDENGRHFIAELGESAMRGRLARVANFCKIVKDGDSFREVDCNPPIEVVRDILSLPSTDWGFPGLQGVVEAPALRSDGSIIQEPGYDQLTGLYYAPHPDFRMPAVPEHPTTEDVERARECIDDTIADFPFVDEASRANAIVSFLTPVCRPAITGPTPLALFDATNQGTGKTLLAEVVSIIATGRPGALSSAPKDIDEWRKQLTSVLRNGAPVVVIDNVMQRLTSGELCKVLTESFHTDRILGQSEMLLLPVRCSWIATGNNIQLGGDMPRRCYWVRMDAKCSRPFNRTGFRHSDLKGWTLEKRGELLCSLLTLARAWYAAGSPAPTIKPLGSFESWTVVVGGILERAGVPGFLLNSEELYARADLESVQWEGFLLNLHEAFYGESFVVADVIAKLEEKNDTKARNLLESVPDYVAEAIGEKTGFLQRRIGHCFSERVGKRFGDSAVYLKNMGTINRAVRWCVVKPETDGTMS